MHLFSFISLIRPIISDYIERRAEVNTIYWQSVFEEFENEDPDLRF